MDMRTKKTMKLNEGLMMMLISNLGNDTGEFVFIGNCPQFTRTQFPDANSSQGVLRSN
jgi:hypothetical protein